jgi:hypothetical protein
VSATVELLAALNARAVRLTAVGDRLRVDAPAGTLTAADRQALAQHKAALLALLVSWDGASADAELSEVLGLLGRAAARTRRSPRQAVLDEYAATARRYHAERDPLLFEARAAALGLLARWREADAGAREAEDWLLAETIDP